MRPADRHARRRTARPRPAAPRGAGSTPSPTANRVPLTASRAPRNAAERSRAVVRPHHHGAAVPARRAARQPVVRRPDQRHPPGRARARTAARRSAPAPAAGSVHPAISPMSRVSRSGAATPARAQRVAQRRPEPVGRGPDLGPVVHRQGGEPARRHAAAASPDAARGRRAPAGSRSDAPPDPCAAGGGARRPRRRSGSGSRRCAAATRSRRRAYSAGSRYQGSRGLAWCTAWKLLLRNRSASGPRSSMITLRPAGPLVRLVLEEGADAQDRRAPASSRARYCQTGIVPASPSQSATGASPAQVQQPRPAPRAGRPPGSRARSSRQRQAMPRNGPISIRPSSVLFAASTARTGRRSRAQTAGIEIVRLRVVVRVGQQRVVVVREMQRRGTARRG